MENSKIALLEITRLTENIALRQDLSNFSIKIRRKSNYSSLNASVPDYLHLFEQFKTLK